ncbi:unnamed protein product [Meganyctiphanes norvegica]|uniref:Uncharacterized protein n=1 Tax=Meganyctiphanes norvegica TaxID=48144 RepID=A0AAV2SC07_MEGNR
MDSNMDTKCKTSLIFRKIPPVDLARIEAKPGKSNVQLLTKERSSKVYTESKTDPDLALKGIDKYVSPKILKLFRRVLVPKPKMRYDVKEVTKDLRGPLVVKGSGEIEIYYDEDLSVKSGSKKLLNKVSRSSSTISASDIYAANYNLGLKRNSYTGSNKSILQTRRSSMK